MQRLLVLDTCTTHVQGGLIMNGQWEHFFSTDKPALESLFTGLEPIFKKANMGGATAIAYACGPGSTLGLRVTATAIRTWKSLPENATLPLFAYQSLPMAAALLEHKEESLSPFAVIAPSRQKHYHCVIKEANTAPYTYTPLHEIDSLEGLPPRCFFLPQAKLWTMNPLIANFTALSYDIQALPSLLSLAPHLLQATDTAIPFQYPHQGGEYVRWNAQRHRAANH